MFQKRYTHTQTQTLYFLVVRITIWADFARLCVTCVVSRVLGIQYRKQREHRTVASRLSRNISLRGLRGHVPSIGHWSLSHEFDEFDEFDEFERRLADRGAALPAF